MTKWGRRLLYITPEPTQSDFPTTPPPSPLPYTLSIPLIMPSQHRSTAGLPAHTQNTLTTTASNNGRPSAEVRRADQTQRQPTNPPGPSHPPTEPSRAEGKAHRNIQVITVYPLSVWVYPRVFR